MKNNYIITKAEVKTIFSIKIPLTQVKDILELAKNSKLKELYWKTDKINLETYLDEPYRDVEKRFANLWRACHTANEVDTIRFIIQLLGFDGVENYGIYNESSKCIEMSVYKYGDQIN